MHDDQHGTAILEPALLNAAELQGKNLAEIKVVVAGAVHPQSHVQITMLHWG